MSNDAPNFVVRRPRYTVNGSAPIVLQVVRSGAHQPAVVNAELVDISRHGMRMKVGDPLVVAERVLVRLKERHGGLERSFAARVLWQLQEEETSWLVGCPLESEVDWETLGELFLQQVIDP